MQFGHQIQTQFQNLVSFSATALLGVALFAALPAQAVVTLDQDALVTPTAVNTAPLATRIGTNAPAGLPSFDLSLVQTATAGLAGYLDHIDLQVARGPGAGILQVGLFDGVFGSGTETLVFFTGYDAALLLPNLTQAFNQTAMLRFDVRAADYLVAPGQQFSIGLNFLSFTQGGYAFAVTGSGPTPQPGVVPVLSYNSYAGGDKLLFANGTTPITTGPLVNGELGFRSFVDVPANSAVPEPSSWVLLMAGFGFVGGALRRSRTIALSM